MTLSTTTVRATVPGSGAAGPFSFAFKIFAATDLLVQKTSVAGVVSVLNYPTDYTVTGVGNASGGTLTLTVALAIGESLSILRAVPNTQPTSFRALGTFFPASHEDEFDRLTMLVQQNTDAIKRSVRLASSIDPAVFTTELPVPVANQALVAKSDGTGWEARTIDTASASLLPSGRTVTSLTAYLANNAVFHVDDYGAKGDGVTNDTAAFNRAITAAIAAGGGNIVTRLATYLLSPITVNTAGIKIAILGQGGGSDRKTTLLFQGTPGATAEGGFKFDAVEGVKLRSLAIEHTGSVVAANGYGIHFNACNYIEMDDVWVYGFGTNIVFDGFAIYSKFVGVRSIHGYAVCMQWNAALHNGNTFIACQFSNSDAGSGVVINGGGGTANVSFRSCYFEGNAVYGLTQTGSGLFTLILDSCYAEANGDWDVYVNNSLASSIAHVILDRCYFDSNNPGNTLTQHWRVEVRNAKLTMRHCRIFQMGGASYYTTPPVRVIDSATGLRGTRPCIAEHCEYETPDISSSMDGWIVTDSKHPFPSYTNGVKPTTLGVHAMQAGQFFWNRLESSIKSTLGWLVTASGKGAATNPSTLATTTIGSALVTVNDTSHPMTTGDIIAVVGTTFNRTGVGGSATEAWARVIDVPSGQLRVDGTAVSAVTSAAMSYRQGVVIEVPTSARPINGVAVSVGGITSWTPISNYSFFIISETNATGHSSIWMQTNGDVFLVYQSDPSVRYVKDNTFATASKINVGYAGGDLEIKNNLASPTTFSVVETAIR